MDAFCNYYIRVIVNDWDEDLYKANVDNNLLP
ncbi:MAG: hypothetical protein ACD_20C00128G0016 [uncultured bacterium]|nr:MAG: hypothetical protein ACD_20C00128G0016 [uncultured bacterium]